jgi:flagellar basal-body rod protein FlgG
MLKALDTAAAGMAAQQQWQDAISNDLANVNTTGYKAVRVGFRDLVYTQADRSSATGVRTGAGAAAVDLGRDWAQGSFQRTDQPLDVAVQGEGFFRVKQPDGTSGLTRDGAFHVDSSGRVVTAGGGIVQPPITLPADTDMGRLTIDRDGTIHDGPTAFGKLDLVTVRAPTRLRPIGDNVFVPTPESGATRPAPATSAIEQGAVEMSNVDVSDQMVAMMQSQRAYQLQSKVITNADRMWEIANGVKR